MRSVVAASQGSMVKVIPGFRSAPVAQADVGDGGALVHGSADAVSGVLVIGVISEAHRDLGNGRGDIADAVAGARRRDSGGQRILGGLDQANIGGPRRSGDHTDRMIGHPAVERDRQIEREQVTVAEIRVVGKAVEDGIVERQAEHVAERAPPEGRRVIPVTGNGATGGDHLAAAVLDLHEVDARTHHVA